MSENKKETLFYTLLIALAMWLICNLMACMGGVASRDYEHSNYYKEPARISYIVLGFRLGCWLGERPGEKFPEKE